MFLAVDVDGDVIVKRPKISSILAGNDHSHTEGIKTKNSIFNVFIINIQSCHSFPEIYRT